MESAEEPAFEPLSVDSEPRPRLWPTLVVMAVAIPVLLFLSATTMIVAAIASVGMDVVTDEEALMDWLKGYVSTPLGVLVLFLPGQVAVIALAVLPGWLSPTPFRERVGLVRTRIPLWCAPRFSRTPAWGR